MSEITYAVKDRPSQAQTTSVPPPPRSRPTPIAPNWHTAVMLAVLTLSAAYGLAALHIRSQTAIGVGFPSSFYVIRYLSSLSTRWLLLGTFVAGLYHRRTFLYETLLRNAQPWYKEVGAGVVIYLCGMLVNAIVLLPLRIESLHLGWMSANKKSLELMAPHTPSQLAVFLLVAITAGITEEIIFRGYLLQQFAAWLNSTRIAIVVSSVLFGLLHMYEGMGAVIAITLLAILWSNIAVARRNLRAVIVAHGLLDTIAGITLYIRATHPIHHL